MKIQLTGTLDQELISIGLKSGDIIEATPDPQSKVGCMHFDIRGRVITHNCSVWPENYLIVKKDKEFIINLENALREVANDFDYSCETHPDDVVQKQ